MVWPYEWVNLFEAEGEIWEIEQGKKFYGLIYVKEAYLFPLNIS